MPSRAFLEVKESGKGVGVENRDAVVDFRTCC